MTPQTSEETMPTTEIVPQEIRPITMLKLTAQEIRSDVNLIQQVLRGVMIQDVHYGLVPGCGDKPALLKPGAEKIMATFRLDGEPLIEDLSSNDETRIRIRMRVTHQITKLEIGWGVGEASSDETKYKWVSPVCDAEFDETPEDRRREKWTKGFNGKPPYKKKQIRASIPDVRNTVLKMAKKRALVDATLTCTGASDVFAQDIEDLPPEIATNVAQDGPAPTGIQRASEKPAAAAPAPAAPSMMPATPAQHVAPQTKAKAFLSSDQAVKMAAKFNGKCKHCNGDVAEKSEILYVRDGVQKGGYHLDCVAFVGE